MAGSYVLTAQNVTDVSVEILVTDDASSALPIEGETVSMTGGISSAVTNSQGIASFSGLTPSTAYTASVTGGSTFSVTFSTKSTGYDDPRTATQEQWEDLATRVKAKSDVVITMTTTDPGEGSILAADHYVGVYGTGPIIMDYSTSEVNTGSKWIDGMAIYKKTIFLGHLPDTSTATVAHNIVGLLSLVKLEGYFTNGTNRAPLPYPSPTATKCVQVYVDTSNITIVTGEDRSAYTGYLTLYYTKSGA